jgi:hypothetical protein
MYEIPRGGATGPDLGAIDWGHPGCTGARHSHRRRTDRREQTAGAVTTTGPRHPDGHLSRADLVGGARRRRRGLVRPIASAAFVGASRRDPSDTGARSSNPFGFDGEATVRLAVAQPFAIADVGAAVT